MQKNIEALAGKSEVDVERMSVAHILISFAGTGTSATRSRDEAEALASATFARVEAGEDFDALAQELSDDSQGGQAGGPYGMFMPNKTSQKGDEYPRTGMVAAFGNVGWKLQVGEVGVAPHDPRTSPYGWHIIKRVK